MKLYEIIWKDRFVEKIANKHGVGTEEVEEILFSKPHVRFAEKGRVKVNTYTWPMGKHKQAGIWLFSSSANVTSLPCRSQPVI